MSRPLFAITEDYQQVDQLLDQLDESGADDQQREQIEAEIMAWVQALGIEQREKIDAYGWTIKRLDEEAQSARAVAAEFQKKAQSREKQVQRLKTIMQLHMETTEQTKLIGKVWTVALQANGGVMPLNVYGPEVLPEEYFYAPEPLPDNAKIRAALEAGIEVPGAMLNERGKSVRIK